jgi:hypothetical protein
MPFRGEIFLARCQEQAMQKEVIRRHKKAGLLGPGFFCIKRVSLSEHQ